MQFADHWSALGIQRYGALGIHKWVTPKNQTCPRLTHGQQIDITYWSPKYAIYNEISSVDYLCELSGAAAGLNASFSQW